MNGQQSSIYSLPFSSCFLDEIVKLWCDGEANIEKGLILVPSRRAARYLTEAFLRKFDKKSVLLPRIAALGAFEEEAPLGADYLVDLNPAISPLERQSIFARLVLEKARNQGRGYRVDIAWQLASFLAELQDEADRAECDLKEKLPEVFENLDADLAKHSRDNLKFLEIITQSWPDFLKEQGLLNPIERQVLFVKETAKLLKKYPYEQRIWAVGFNDISTGVGDLLESVALQKKGKIILQGLDYSLAEIKSGEQTLFDQLPPSHPQYMLAELLHRLEVKLKDVKPLLADKGQGNFWNAAMLPSHFFARNAGRKSFECPSNLFEIEANESQHEARCIALSLCDAIADPKKTAALVTSDRKLIKRVSAELERFGVHTDSGPGTLLSDTVPAIFIRLILKIFEDGWRVQDCLALLKHPLCGLGLTRGECRDLTRKLEKKIRVERRSFSDFKAVQHYFEQSKDDSDLKDFVRRLTEAFEPLFVINHQSFSMVELIRASVVTAEKIASYHDKEQDQDIEGAHALWVGEDGNRLAEHIALLIDSVKQFGTADFLGIEKFFTQSLKSISIIGLHGYQDGEKLAHPRIFILGLMEARLLSFDLTIIGSVTEGNLPPSAEPSPWLSRALYKDVGLYPTQRQVGSAAYNFLSKVSGVGDVILSHSKRQGTTPLMESSWLVRAKALLGTELPQASSVRWDKARSDTPEATIDRPRPCPSNDAKPTSFPMTSVDNLVNNPFTFYLEQILRLRKLDTLDAKGSKQDFGTIIHEGLENFYNKYPEEFPENGEGELREFLIRALKKSYLPEIHEKWLIGRIENIAAWIASKELPSKKRKVFHEVELNWNLKTLETNQPVKLNARLDRIDFLDHEDDAKENIHIIDYKTGAVPSVKQVVQKEKNQLTIEAAALLDPKEIYLELQKDQKLIKDMVERVQPEDIALFYWGIKGASSGNKETAIKPNKRGGITNDDLVSMKQFLRETLETYLKQDHVFEILHHHDLYEEQRHLARYEEWRGGGHQAQGDVV